MASQNPNTSAPCKTPTRFSSHVARATLQYYFSVIVMLRLCGFAMAATASASAASLSLRSSPFKLNPPKLNSVTLRFPHLNRRYNSAFRVVAASVSVSNPNVQTGPDDLVASILSKVNHFVSFRINLCLNKKISCYLK